MQRTVIKSTSRRKHPAAIQNVSGLVAQLVRAPPCHGGGRGFESHPGRFVDF